MKYEMKEANDGFIRKKACTKKNLKLSTLKTFSRLNMQRPGEENDEALIDAKENCIVETIENLTSSVKLWRTKR